MKLKWIIRPVLVVAALIALGSGILLLGSGAAYILVWPKEKTLDRVWSETWTALTSIPPDSISTRFPKTEVNDSARKLERLMARLGIEPAPHRARPTKEASEAFHHFAKVGLPYLASQLRRPDNRIDPPPAQVKDFLAAHQGDLTAIKALFLDQQPPHWEMDINQNLTVSLLPNASYPVPVAVPRSFAPEIPRWEMDADQPFSVPHRSLGGLLQLQRVLALDVLEKTRSGRARAALEMLEVSWKLNTLLRERPEMMSTMISLYVASRHSGILRKIDGVSSAWQQRLGNFNYRRAYLLAQEAESWHLFQWARRADFRQLFGAREASPFFETPLSKPYLRWCAADLADKAIATMVELQKQDICSIDPDAFRNKPELLPARWNTVRQFIIQPEDVAVTWQLVGRILLHLEMTRKVLQIKELRRTSPDRSRPKQVAGLESSVCPGERWIYRVTPAGVMSVSFSKRLPGQNGFLPLIYVASAQ